MLINATNPEEIRVAMVDGQKLVNLDIESANRQQKKGNIYKGRVTRVEASLQAAFVDYGSERQGFLPLKEVAREYYPSNAQPATPGSRKLRIQEVLEEGQELVLQVDKEERGTKGAAITTFPSLAGRYLVLMPNNPRAGGVSRRIEGEDRKALREALASLELPEGVGIIVRTAGLGRKAEELQRDLNHLLHLWNSILKQAQAKPAPCLIYEEGDAIIRALRDNFEEGIDELLVDSKEVLETAQHFMQAILPECAHRVKYYQDSIPLFSKFQIEQQIDTAYSRVVPLEGGGSLVIDPTEALVAIDINSARATKGADLEETALQTNLEAAEEIPRQLRLRDVGGLIVIDFIDMRRKSSIVAVEEKLREAVQADRARVKIGKISRFGLLDMSRQRLRPSLGEATHTVCPLCGGQGRIRATESAALHLLRILEEEVLKERTDSLMIQVPVNIATYLLNEKRPDLLQLEERYKVQITITPDPSREAPDDYTLERGLTKAPAAESPSHLLSYSIFDRMEAQQSKTSPAQEPSEASLSLAAETASSSQESSTASPEQGLQPREEITGLLEDEGFMQRIIRSLFGEQAVQQTTAGAKGVTTSPATANANETTDSPRSTQLQEQPAATSHEETQSGTPDTPPDTQRENSRRGGHRSGRSSGGSSQSKRGESKRTSQGASKSTPKEDKTQTESESNNKGTKRKATSGSSQRGRKRSGDNEKSRSAETASASSRKKGNRRKGSNQQATQQDQHTTRQRVTPPQPSTEEIEVPPHTAEFFEEFEEATPVSGGESEPNSQPAQSKLSTSEEES